MSHLAWQAELRDSIHSVAELREWGWDLPEEVEKKFRLAIPRYYLNLIDKQDTQDPIARMALPSANELGDATSLNGDALSDSLRDPIGDLAHQVAPRLTHRYPDRALLHVTNLCQMYCRFCFRKNLMNEKEPDLYAGDFAPAFAYLEQHSEIQELILSGGDPWILSDDKIAWLVQKVSNDLPQVKRLRFHTRMPVTLPSRITAELISALSARDDLQIIIVTHFNHPRELTNVAAVGLKQLRQAGFLILNQSVLLKGVNDSTAILRELFLGLGNQGVIPYYLHHCDLVAGAEHFRTTIALGRKIWAELRGTLPGYLLPEYILETPGGGGKVPLGKSAVKKLSKSSYRIKLGEKKIPYREKYI